MRLLVGVAVLVDRRLDVGVAQLLLDEVDRLACTQPERGGGVAKVVEANSTRQSRVLQGVVVAAAANVVTVKHEPFGTAEDKLVEPAGTRLASPVLA
jgi:hypothetical protein